MTEATEASGGGRWPGRTIQGVRTLLLVSLLADNRRWVTLGWVAAVLAASLIVLGPVLLFGERRSGDPEAQLGGLSAAERRLIAASTASETRQIGRLSMLRAPLPAAPPPAQSAGAIPAGELFGIPTDGAAAFDQLTANLRESSADCEAALAAADSGATAPAGVVAAQDALSGLTSAASRDRAPYHYHQGLIALCGPSRATAAQEFEAAAKGMEDYVNLKGGDRKRLPPDNGRRLAQYETVNNYGLGLSYLAGQEADKPPNKADEAFAKALAAAVRTRPYAPPGPFVRLSRDGCARKNGDCDLFEFSTAEIYNARLAAWLASGRPREAYAKTQGALAGAPSFLAHHPALAANFAAAAAASGDRTTATRLYGVVRAALENDGPDAAAWKTNPQALARLAALAAIGGSEVYAEGDSAWWPRAPKRSAFRTRFETVDPDKAAIAGKGAEWFPEVNLEDPPDEAMVDVWLWVRRDRALLSAGEFDLFRQAGLELDNLGAGERDFLRGWRREVTASLGEGLLKRARQIQDAQGLKAATPLLELLAGRDFPLLVQAQARLILAYGQPPWVVLTLVGILIVLLALAGFAHRELNVGQSRTFTRRHFRQRGVFETRSGKPEQAPG